MLSDLNLAIRQLLKNRGFTIIAVLTLALGIGANTTIFTIVNEVLLRPLPYPDSERLVLLEEADASRTSKFPCAPVPFLALKSQRSSLDDIAALSNKGWSCNLTGSGNAERLQGYEVSANLFSLLSVPAALGRTFNPEEDRLGADPVVVLSHGLWKRRFGSDSSIIGQAITLNGKGYTVIGVMPHDFQFYAKTDLWTPLHFSAQDEKDTDNHYLFVIGRLSSGATLKQAQTEFDSILLNTARNPKERNHGSVIAAQDNLVAEVRPTLWILFGAVGFVLLIACINITNLLLAKATGRRNEMAVRLALGASRWHLIRQLLTECVLLSFLGGAFALLITQWGIGFLVTGLPPYLLENNSTLRSIGVDRSILLFAAGVSLLTSVVFGLVPALQSTKTNLQEALLESGRSGTSTAKQNRFRDGLIVAEVALAFVLLVSAGLMVKSFWQLQQVDPGFNPDHLIAFDLNPSEAKYTNDQQIALFSNQLIEQISTLPGVQHAGGINNLSVSLPVLIDELRDKPEGKINSRSRLVTPGYFQAMQVPLIKGRLFSNRDGNSAPLVAIIDETFAKRVFPNEDPIGKHVQIWDASREIVGVVGSMRDENLADKPQPSTFLPYDQVTWRGMTVLVRSSRAESQLIPEIRKTIFHLDSDLPLYSVRTLQKSLQDSISRQRFSTALLSLFGMVALIMAAIGIFGVMSYFVIQRTREIGIRMALGASRSDVLKDVLQRGTILTSLGLLLGFVSALGTTKLLSSLLFGTKPTDPLTFAVIALLLSLAAFLACLLPALRATKVDPMIALRNE